MEKRSHRYRVVDVFTQTPLEGNPLAVFTDATGLEPAMMQSIARELNLAETTFIIPPTRADCAARVRIFTPRNEMRFAGHPTIGTAFVLLDEGRLPADRTQIRLEELVGPVAVRLERGTAPLLWLTTPPIEDGDDYDPMLCAKLLGLDRAEVLDIPPQRLSAGNPTVYVALRDQSAVDRAWLDLAGMQQLRGKRTELMCVFVFTPTAGGAYARMFAPEYGVPEDPATGSAAGPLAAYMTRHGLLPRGEASRFVCEQGAKMGRRSLLHVHMHGRAGNQEIEVGGHVTPVAEGTFRL